MQPSPGNGFRGTRIEQTGPGFVQKAVEPCLLSGPFEQLAWLSDGQGCSASPAGPISLLSDAFLPQGGLPVFPAPDATNPYGMACGQSPGLQACKLPLPFPTQSLPSLPFPQQQQQQSSLAATFSRLSSQLEAQFGVPSWALEGDDGELADRDDYLMRLLRRGHRPAGAQPSGTQTQPSSQQPLLEGAPVSTRGPKQASPAQPRLAPPAAQASSREPEGDALMEGQEDSPVEDAPSPLEQHPQPAVQQQKHAGPDFGATVATLGETEACRVRATILRQQVTFTEQLYELHRAAAVQRLLMRNRAPPAPDSQRQQQTAQQRRRQQRAGLPPPAPKPAPAQSPSSGAEAGRQPRSSGGSLPAAHSSPRESAPKQPPATGGGASLPPGFLAPQGPANSSLPPHLQPGAYGAPPADPMAWWYHTHYGSRPLAQQVMGQLPGFAPATGSGDLSPRTAATAAAAAAPALQQQQKLAQPSASAASGGAADGAAAAAAAPRPAKWWQDPQATFGPPGDPEVVARQSTLRGLCEVESAPPRSLAIPERSGASGRKRKSMESGEEASSETTGRALAAGSGGGRAATVTVTAGGSGADCASAFQRRLPVRPKPARPPAASADAKEPKGQRVEEHAAHMLLSFSSRQA